MVETQVYVYGHKLDAEEIERRYPFSMHKVRKSIYNNKRYTVTFDILMAYSFRLKGYKVVSWGGLYKGVLVFIFRKARIKASELPF